MSSDSIQDPLSALIQEVFHKNGFQLRPLAHQRAGEQLLAIFQERAGAWAARTFGVQAANNIATRRHRFLEEALELCQSLGGTPEEAHQLVDYVFNRPVGEPAQEVGGVMVTLAVLCEAAALNMSHDGFRELFRVEDPAVAAKIREKHLNKPKFGPLPE